MKKEAGRAGSAISMVIRRIRLFPNDWRKGMRSLSFAAIAIWLLAVSGCVEQHDWHRGWWDEHHRGERYEAERAE